MDPYLIVHPPISESPFAQIGAEIGAYNLAVAKGKENILRIIETLETDHKRLMARARNLGAFRQAVMKEAPPPRRQIKQAINGAPEKEESFE